MPGGSPRLLSLDVFRGLTIAAMILVNNPGTWRAVYPPLAHADWHGWTPADLVFPFFLFIVGVSITLALGRAGGVGMLARIGRRAGVLFALGLFLAGFPWFDLATIRIPGVLQRIAVCYLVAALLLLFTGWRTQAGVAAALLLGYWALLTLVPVPGFGAGDLGKEGNLAAWVDRRLLGPHLWRVSRVYDPEGLLSTLPAIATTLSGVLAGHWLRRVRAPARAARGLAAAGVAATLLGLGWGAWLPINKALWTSSYAVFTTGVALLILAGCHWTIEIAGWRGWSAPFVALGRNAIAAFVLSTFVARVMLLVKLPRNDGARASLHAILYERLFAPLGAPAATSLLFALVYLAAWIAVMALLQRRHVFIRV